MTAEEPTARHTHADLVKGVSPEFMSIQNRITLSILFILTLLALFYVQYDFAQRNPGGDDSLPRWLGTRAWLYEGMNPYSEVVSQGGQLAIGGSLARGTDDRQLFVYPFYVVIYYLPVIWLSFNVARAIWMILLEFSVAGIVVLSAKAFSWSPPVWLLGASIALTVMMYNSIRTIILWQLAGSVAFLIILAVWALKSKRDILAAVSLALASIKPQMVFLILPLLVIWALLNKRSRFVLSLVLSLGMLAGFSFIAMPSWLGDMLNQIRQYPSYTTPALLYVITGSFPPEAGTIVQWVLLVLFVLWLAWEWKVVLIDKVDADYAIVLTLLITNIIVPRSSTTDYLMMLPGFFLIFAIMEKRSAQRSYGVVLWLELAYFAGTWILFALTVDVRFETLPMLFPMPLLLLAGLIWLKSYQFRDRPSLASAEDVR